MDAATCCMEVPKVWVMESPPTQNRSGASGVGGAITGSTGAGGASVLSVWPSAVSASFWASNSSTSVSVPWFLPRASSTPPSE